MTTTAQEVIGQSANATPAQAAMAAAAVYALAAQQGVHTGALAYLAGRIDRPQFIGYAASTILRAMAKAMTTGQHYAAEEWNKVPTGTLVTEQTQTRIEQAVTTIVNDEPEPEVSEVSDIEPEIEDDLTDYITAEERAAIFALEEEPEEEPDEDEDHDQLSNREVDHDPPVLMRTERLAKAETITAGRTAYTATVAKAVEDSDYEYTWSFETNAGACGRCLALAQKTFETFEAAPADGAHPGCLCDLSAHVIEEESTDD